MFSIFIVPGAHLLTQHTHSIEWKDKEPAARKPCSIIFRASTISTFECAYLTTNITNNVTIFMSSHRLNDNGARIVCLRFIMHDYFWNMRFFSSLMQTVDHFISITIDLDVWRPELSNGYCVVVRICDKSQFYIPCRVRWRTRTLETVKNIATTTINYRMKYMGAPAAALPNDNWLQLDRFLSLFFGCLRIQLLPIPYSLSRKQYLTWINV